MNGEQSQPDGNIDHNSPFSGLPALYGPVDHIGHEKGRQQAGRVFDEKKESGDQKFVILAPIKAQKHHSRVIAVLFIVCYKLLLHFPIISNDIFFHKSFPPVYSLSSGTVRTSA